MSKKLIFKDVVGKDFILYYVSRNGSIKKQTIKAKYSYDFPMRKSSLHMNKNGNIAVGWGYAYLLNADEAAELATRIVTTKYNNSIAKIKEITNVLEK